MIPLCIIKKKIYQHLKRLLEILDTSNSKKIELDSESKVKEALEGIKATRDTLECTEIIKSNV